MKQSDFKQLIREMVREEISNVLPSLLSEFFINKLAGTPEPSQKQQIRQVPSNSNIQKKQSVKKPVIEQPKEVRYTSNPVLNSILNETANSMKEKAIQSEREYDDLIPAPDLKMAAQPISYLEEPNVQESLLVESKQLPHVEPVPIQSGDNVQLQKKLGIYKDYRALLKTVESKKKSGTVGLGVSLDGNINGGFNTIE